MRSKRTVWLALLAALAMVLAACGSESGDTTTTEEAAAPTTTEAPAEATTTAAAETTTTAAAEDGTTTTVPVVRADADLVIWADDTRTPVIKEFADEFAAANGITVAVQELGYGDIRDRLVTAAPAGEGPDIIIGGHDWLGQLVSAGVVAPLDLAAVEGDFPAAAISAFNYEGSIYGLPYAIENIALVRNVDLAPDTPASFEDMVETGQALVDEGTTELALVIQQNPGDPYHNYPIVTSFGGYVFGRGDDGAYDPEDIGIDSEGGLAAATYFGELAADGILFADMSWDVMTGGFSDGDTAFVLTGPWATGIFDEAGVNYVVEPIPSVGGGEPQPFIGVQGFMMSAFAENPLIASTFLIDYMATQEAQEALFTAGGRPPANSAAFTAVAETDPNIKGFGEAGQNGYPMPAIPEMGSVWEAWTNAYDLIWSGNDPVQAFTDAAEQIRTLIAEG